jgi:hypothetical protein
MKKYNSFICICCACILLTSCEKTNTSYYEDPENNNTAIFSNKGFNLFTCFVNAVPWRTSDRKTFAFFSRPTFEIDIQKIRTNTVKDSLLFKWNRYDINGGFYERLELILVVDSSFTAANFMNTFEGKRISVDSSANGYFTTNIGIPNSNNPIQYKKGNGVIFFQKASINATNGIIAGLLEAKIRDQHITNGRFDHEVNETMVNF